MDLTFNLDEPLEDQLENAGRNSEPPEEPPPRQEKKPQRPKAGATTTDAETPAKPLRLPLIGRLSLGLQLQVLLVAFVVFLALAGYVAVMDVRTSANRAAHLGLAGEIGVLTERMARLAPAAVDSASPARAELNVVRQREANLLGMLDVGGSFDGRAIPPADETLGPALDQARKRWLSFDQALVALLTPEPVAAVGAAPVDRLADLNQHYVLLRDAVSQLRRDAGDSLNKRSLSRALIAGLGSLAMLMLVLFFRVFNDDAAARQALLARQRREAEEANAETQEAIRQLMDEMTNLADGDLTARATVSENITGAIADAMNYAIEELSVLVKRINDAARRVATASGVAARTSEELLAASEAQSHEIRRASGQVLSMAQAMNEVLGKAEQSASVARQSLEAADKGATAVADSISGMDGIRGQIQETSKRIKRLGESSQEIGEIVELISDITEQTNVLALNAAIQAASAGEAGRGFTVVAEEVQRLAESSAGATRRIAALVKTIQADTQQAVAAMENSTQGVIEGARLSDAAGQALADISTVSKQLAEMIEGISSDTLQQAEVATKVAQAMREILRITEQTGSGTRSTAISISEIADLAVELKGSVAGFKV